MDIEKHMAQCAATLDAILTNVAGITESCRILAEQLAAEREMLEAKGEIEPEPKREKRTPGLR